MPTPTNTYGFYLVWNPEGYSPKKRHATKESADAEARRLSIATPDKSFYVLKTTEVFRTRTEVITTTSAETTHFDHDPAAIPPITAGQTWGSPDLLPVAINPFQRFDVIFNDGFKMFNALFHQINWNSEGGRVILWRYTNGKRD